MRWIVKLWFVPVLFVAAGCSGTSDNSRPEAKGDPAFKEKVLLGKEPAGAKGVLETKQDAEDGKEVVVAARIGGTGKPFAKGLASFRVIDLSKEPCEDDGCGNPWCELDKKEVEASSLFVKFVDDGGKTVAQDAEQSLGLKLCQIVVVKGQLKKDGEGNVSLVASGLHVRPQ